MTHWISLIELDVSKSQFSTSQLLIQSLIMALNSGQISWGFSNKNSLKTNKYIYLLIYIYLLLYGLVIEFSIYVLSKKKDEHWQKYLSFFFIIFFLVRNIFKSMPAY